jgi:hypothetical protein
MPAQPVVALGLSKPQIDGLAAEQLSLHLAREARGNIFFMPTQIAVNGQMRGHAQVTESMQRLEPIMRRVFRALPWYRCQLRGAICVVKKPSTRNFECDIRMRYRGRLVLTSLKTGQDLRRVKSYHKAGSRILKNYRAAAAGGRWQGPHPRHGKRSFARYVGALSVTPHQWCLQIYRRAIYAPVATYGSRSGAQGRAAAKAKAKAAPKAKAKAAPKAKAKAAPKAAPARPPAAPIPHDPASDDSEASSNEC